VNIPSRGICYAKPGILCEGLSKNTQRLSGDRLLKTRIEIPECRLRNREEGFRLSFFQHHLCKRSSPLIVATDLPSTFVPVTFRAVAILFCIPRRLFMTTPLSCDPLSRISMTLIIFIFLLLKRLQTFIITESCKIFIGGS
jgi:hypothetical protein